MAGFDPSSARPVPFDPGSARPVAFDPTSAAPAPEAAPARPRRPAATGLGMIGETFHDIMAGGAPVDHEPNAIESGIMATAEHPLVRSAVGDYQQAALTGLFAQPTRAAMEALNVGRVPGETDAAFHQRYSRALLAARQQAAQTSANAEIKGDQNIETLITGKRAPMTFGQHAERLAQQAIGIGAGITANPQYFLIPGGGGVGGGLRGAATRIGAAGGANALIGGASDAAAQLMDMAEGDQKEYDVNRTLQASAVGGLFGAALHGVHEATPFVKGLFTNRGVDTTPGANPTGSPITPLTQDHIPLNQADAMQYRQLLRTGGVDDIKAFFQGRNGPQPSYQEINAWVSHRGASAAGYTGEPATPAPHPNFDYEQQYNDHVENQWREQNRSAVEEHVNAKMAGWKNAPQVEVVHGPQDIADPAVREQAIKDDPDGNALGFLGPDGKVRMFSGRITDPDTASAVLFHEGLGHHGLNVQFGDKLDSVLTSLLDRNVNGLARDTNAWMKQNKGAYGGSRVRAAEEVLADRSNKGQLPKSWQNAVSSMVRQFGRKMGLKLAYSDAEVNHVLSMAHDAIVNGKPGAAENGFRGATQAPNKFMFIGKEARGFNPHDETAFTPSDGQVRNEISDRHARLHEPQPEGDSTLGDVLHHPELFYRYPQLRDLPVFRGDLNEEGLQGNLGAYDSAEPRMYLHSGDLNGNKPLHIVLHETQHAIQHIENQLPEMGTHDLSYDDAIQVPVEKEAMATEARQDMTHMDRVVRTPKFVTKAQLDRARGPNYLSDDLDSIAQHIEEHYTPNVVSREETRAEALRLGISPKQIAKMSEREAGELAARVSRMGYAANVADVKVRSLLDKVDTPEWKPEDHVALASAIADRNYLVERFKGEGNELGRALAVTRVFKSYTNGTLAETLAALREEGTGLAHLADPTNPEGLKFARQLKQMMNSNSPNPRGINAMISGVNKPYWEQYLTTFHMNAMLSALSTHIKAPIDMATGITRNVIEKVVAMPIGQVRQLYAGMTGKVAKPGVEAAELANHIIGITRAVTDMEVYRAALHAVKTGEGSYVTQDATGASVRTPSNFANQFGALSNPRIPGISKPTDLISAQDTVFRSVEINAQLDALGARAARAQLGPRATTSDVMTLGHTLATTPTPSMLKEAYDETNRTLLLNDNPLNAIINKARVYRPGMNPLQRFTAFFASNLAPFIRVESNNLINRIIDRSPMGLYKLFDPKSDLRAGGARGDIAAARILYGTVLLGVYWAAADKAHDYLTGTNGASNVDKYKEDLAAGRVPNAVHEDGRYNTGGQLGMSVNPFDMHNKTAQMVAGVRQSYEEGASTTNVGTGFKLAAGSLMYDLAENSWISDFAPVIDAMRAHGTEGQNVVSGTIANEAQTWIPGAINQAARLNDPNQRDTTAPDSISGHIANTVQATIPGLREQLPIKYSVYGNPLPNGASLTGVHTWIPGLSGNGTTETLDPTERELDRLNGLISSTLVTPVSKSFKLEDGSTKHLTPAEFEEYQRVAGRAIVATVHQEMSTPEWHNMSDQDRVLEVKSIETDMKKAAREALFH